VLGLVLVAGGFCLENCPKLQEREPGTKPIIYKDLPQVWRNIFKILQKPSDRSQ